MRAVCSQILLDKRVSFSPSPTPWYLFPSPTFLCSSTTLKNPAERTHEIGFTRFYKIFRSRSYVMERFRRSLAPCQFHLRHHCSMHRYSCIHIYIYICISIYIFIYICIYIGIFWLCCHVLYMFIYLIFNLCKSMLIFENLIFPLYI